MSTINEPYSAKGIIIRDEQVYYADKDGVVEFLVQDNEWVRVDAHVASIIEPYMAQTAARHLSAVQNQAINVQSRRYATAISDAEVTRLNTNINNTVNGRIHNFKTINLSEIYSLRDDVNRIMIARNQININDGISARDSLIREYDRHSMALDEYSRNMYANASGIMSRIIDGKESVLTVSSINNLTRYDVQEIVDYTTLLPRQEVQAGESVFRVVGNTWYIAAYVPNDMLFGFIEGTTRTVYLHNAISGSYESHNLWVQSIEHGARYSLVVFRSTRHVTDFINQRNVSFRTTSGIQRGLKLPYTAITTTRHYRIPHEFIHGTVEPYVLLSTYSADMPVPVVIDNYDETYAFIPITPDISLGNVLIPNNTEYQLMLLSEDHLVEQHGVYRVVMGIATFTSIDLGESNIEAGYVLLDPAINPNIREFSNIVTVASTVNHGDIVG